MSHLPAQIQDQDDKTWITLADAAQILELTESTVQGYISDKRFQSIGKGRGARVLLGDVRAYERKRDPRKSLGGKIRGTRRTIINEEEWEKLTPELSMRNGDGVQTGVYREKVQTGSYATREWTYVAPQDESPTVLSIGQSAREELVQVQDQLTILLTRKAELEEVIQAVELIERFARLAPPDAPQGKGHEEEARKEVAESTA